jgi:hypothetical protein
MDPKGKDDGACKLHSPALGRGDINNAVHIDLHADLMRIGSG